MSVKYRKVINNRKNSPTKGKVYGKAVYSNIANIAELSEEIEEATSLTGTDVKATVNALVGKMNKHLRNGDKVVLDGFGSFKIGLTTTPANTAAEFTAANVKSMHIIFTPAIEMYAGKRVKTLLKNVKAEEMPKYAGLDETDGTQKPATPGGASGSDTKDNPSSGGSGSSTDSGSTDKGDSGDGDVSYS